MAVITPVVTVELVRFDELLDVTERTAIAGFRAGYSGRAAIDR